MEHSLLNKIKSKFIIQKILSLAFSETKPILKLIKYDKNLMKKLDIDFKDHFKYEVKGGKIHKRNIELHSIFFWGKTIFQIITIILYLIYIIIFYTKEKFNEKNLKEKYDIRKKNFVDFMDNYILLAYLIFFIVDFFSILFLIDREVVALKGYTKFIILSFFAFIDLTHFILYSIKFDYTKKLLKNSEKHTWFYKFDITLIIFLVFCISFFLNLWMDFCFTICNKEENIDDQQEMTLKKIKGINVIDFELPIEFKFLKEKEKYKIIFSKENMRKYKYKLNENQINLINKINDIKRQNNLPELNYFTDVEIPDFIIKDKLELFFYNYEKINKLSKYSYIFKYPKNEFQNFLNDKEILDIITIDFLDTITIIQQNDIEFIAIYTNNIHDNEIKRINNKFNQINISYKKELSENYIANTEDNLNISYNN